MKNYKKAILVVLCLLIVLAAYAGCAKTYKISYYDNEKLITTQTVNNGSKPTRPADPVKEGYTFEGWYQNQSLTTKFNFDQKIMKDTKVYAKFVTSEGTPSTD